MRGKLVLCLVTLHHRMWAIHKRSQRAKVLLSTNNNFSLGVQSPVATSGR